MNGTHGVTPLAFLGNVHVPPNMYHIPNINRIIEGHLRGSSHMETCFSSWAAEFGVALAYAGKSGCVALLDTTLLTSTASVYYTPHLELAGLSNISYPEEYLAYGPITGAGYHCVKVSDFGPDLEEMKTNYADPDKGNTYPSNNPRGLWITHYQVWMVERIAKRFRRPDDARPDVVLFVTAVMLALLNPTTGIEHKHRLMELICYRLRQELEAYCRPASNSRSLGLISPTSSNAGLVVWGNALSLLTDLDTHIRSNGLSQ